MASVNPISKKALDIWEHASLLYHGFEWESAAENFSYLSGTLTLDIERTLCLLNAAIIYARLGEFTTARSILDTAEPTGELLPLTMFIIGHVEFELENYDKSKECLQIALKSLNGTSQRYSHLGLQFILKASHIKQNLQILDSRNDFYGIAGAMAALPADNVFEPPERARNELQCSTVISSNDSATSDQPPTLTDGSASPSNPSTPTDEYPGTTVHKYDWWHPHEHTTRPRIKEPIDGPDHPSKMVCLSTCDLETPLCKNHCIDKTTATLAKNADDGNFANNPKRLTELMHRLSKRSMVRTIPINQVSQTSRRGAMEPREARVQSDSVRHLAAFIKEMPAQNAISPGSAETHHESLKDLADFFRDSGPNGHDEVQAGSLYFKDIDNDSAGVASHDLLTDEALIRRAQSQGKRPSPPARHPRRTHVGGPFAKGASLGSRAPAPLGTISRDDTNSRFEATHMDTDQLHDLFARVNDVQRRRDLPPPNFSRPSFASCRSVSAYSSRPGTSSSRHSLDQRRVPRRTTSLGKTVSQVPSTGSVLGS